MAISHFFSRIESLAESAFAKDSSRPCFSCGFGFFITHAFVSCLVGGWPIPNLNRTKSLPDFAMIRDRAVKPFQKKI